MSDQTALIAATLLQSYGSVAIYRQAEYEDVMRRAIDCAVRLEELAEERHHKGVRLSPLSESEQRFAASQEVEEVLA